MIFGFGVWFVVCLFVYIGIDEVAMIHENVPTYINEMFPVFASSYESFFC